MISGIHQEVGRAAQDSPPRCRIARPVDRHLSEGRFTDRGEDENPTSNTIDIVVSDIGATIECHARPGGQTTVDEEYPDDGCDLPDGIHLALDTEEFPVEGHPRR